MATSLTHAGADEVRRRMGHGHQFWLASVDGEAAGWGWCAHRELSIGELGIDRSIAEGNRYLWDFFTIPAWRGRGIYPRLLQEIVRRDRAAERFWLGHDMGNWSSRRGIAKAGFREVGTLYRQSDGAFILIPSESGAHADAAARFFAVTVADVNSTSNS